jgi:NodT family efflux transporter outer membrane factor (OMF) lipoprotein
MISSTLTRGSALGALAAMLTACGHLPVAPPAFEEMAGQRTGLPTDWTLSTMSGDPSAMIADYSVFGDPRLTDLLKEALDNNRSLRAAQENVRQSEAFLKQTRAGLWPTLRAAAGVRSTSLTDDLSFDLETYSFDLAGSYTPDIMGDLSSSIQASTAGLRSSEATYELARRQLAAQVARAYFAVIEQKLQLELDRRALARAVDTYRITKTRFEAGSAARDELVLGQSTLASSEDNVIASEASVRAAVRSLEVLLGRFPTNALDLSAALPEPPNAPPLGLPELTIRSRPDVVAAEYNLVQAFANVQIAKLSRWPQLDGSVGLNLANRTTDTTTGLFDFDNLAMTLGLSLAQSIFDGGAITGRIEASEASKRAALQRYGQAVIDAYSGVVNAIDQFNTLQSRSKSLQTASDAARETVRLSELRYNEGSQNLLDLINVRERADLQESLLIANRRARLDQWIVLHQALGGDPSKAVSLSSSTASGAS